MSSAASPAHEAFSLSVVPNRQEVTVVPSGDLDLASCEELDREARELRDRGFDRIVIDLRRVGFLDSSALRVLLSLRNDAKRNHHTLTLIPGPAPVQRLFAITATRGLFDWRDY